jgi:hypothetical protein
MQNTSADPSRRQLIAWGGAASAAGLAAYLGWPTQETPTPAPTAPSKVGTATQKPAELAPVPAGPFSRDLFMPHLGSEFTVKHDTAASAACKLIEVSPATVMKTAKGTFVAFSLVFESHPSFLQDGGTCRVSHPQLEPMEIFLSPIGQAKKDKTLLEAAFTLRA